MISKPSPIAVLDGQALNVATEAGLLANIEAYLQEKRGFTLFTLNLDHMVKRRSDRDFANAYTRATFVTADGAPVAAMARRQGVRVERTTGADLIWPACELAARTGAPIFLFGSSEQSLRQAAVVLQARLPDLKICGIEAPPQGFDPLSKAADDAGARIAASGAQLCFVALGAPKQEIFCDRMFARHAGVGYLCIGAALDFIAGSQVRAPRIFQTVGAEWVWRLMSDPRRLTVRYARCAGLLAHMLVFGRRGAALP